MSLPPFPPLSVSPLLQSVYRQTLDELSWSLYERDAIAILTVYKYHDMNESD